MYHIIIEVIVYFTLMSSVVPYINTENDEIFLTPVKMSLSNINR